MTRALLLFLITIMPKFAAAEDVCEAEAITKQEGDYFTPGWSYAHCKKGMIISLHSEEEVPLYCDFTRQIVGVGRFEDPDISSGGTLIACIYIGYKRKAFPAPKPKAAPAGAPTGAN